MLCGRVSEKISPLTIFFYDPTILSKPFQKSDMTDFTAKKMIKRKIGRKKNIKSSEKNRNKTRRKNETRKLENLGRSKHKSLKRKSKTKRIERIENLGVPVFKTE